MDSLAGLHVSNCLRMHVLTKARLRTHSLQIILKALDLGTEIIERAWQMLHMSYRHAASTLPAAHFA